MTVDMKTKTVRQLSRRLRTCKAAVTTTLEERELLPTEKLRFWERTTDENQDH